MTDLRVKKLARTLVNYSTKVRPKDHVAIVGSPNAAPLMLELFREVLRAGGYPYPFLGLELLNGMDGFDSIFLKEANDDQLTHILRTDEMILTEFEVMISIRSHGNTRALSSIDPDRQKLRRQARSSLMETYLERGASGDLRWCGTLFPTQAYAQDAEMSLDEFEEYVYSTTFSDSEDPIKEWQAIHDQQQKLVDWLKGKKHVEVKGPHVDLRLSIEDRIFINSDGVHNMPSGEIFTAPVEDSVQGWVEFTYPAIREGREVEGISLHFENGEIVKAAAEKNDAFLQKMLEVDSGARRLGEFAIGTNKRINRFIKNILYDEKIGGTIHMAIGSGYPETGSKNKSAIHWDMICDMRDGGEIIVDGELIYRSGEFLI